MAPVRQQSYSSKVCVEKTDFIIAVDFDGTITKKSCFPEVGEINPMAIKALKALQKRYKIALWTCRFGQALEEAVQAVEREGFNFDFINCTDLDRGNRKIIVDAFIDDTSYPYCLQRPFTFDWEKICKDFGVDING